MAARGGGGGDEYCVFFTFSIFIILENEMVLMSVFVPFCIFLRTLFVGIPLPRKWLIGIVSPLMYFPRFLCVYVTVMYQFFPFLSLCCILLLLFSTFIPSL